MTIDKNEPDFLSKVCDCFQQKLAGYGETPEGVYWNSAAAQEIRFAQIIKVCDWSVPFSLIDYGCGYGALIDFLDFHGLTFKYYGFDISQDMIARARVKYADRSNCTFYDDASQLKPADYLVASGIFNLKLNIPDVLWKEHVLGTLKRMNELSQKGFAFNMLTTYSDPERMRSDLYYADPLFFFDYCKRFYARNTALLHDYELYDFTIIVRK